MSTSVARSNANVGTCQPKPRRVRTGCLTCRERHLKCDEGIPDCRNCCKSHRVCKRGVKLNFLDTNVHELEEVPPLESWQVDFLDESLDVASEYKNGLSKYMETRGIGKPSAKQTRCFEPGKLKQAVLPISPAAQKPSHGGSQTIDERLSRVWTSDHIIQQHFTPHATTNSAPAPQKLDSCAAHELSTDAASWPWWSSTNDFDPIVAQITRARAFDRGPSSTASDAPQATHAPSQVGSPRFEGGAQLPVTPPEDKSQCNKHTPREYLHEYDEVAYMEVFVSEVGIWMDCFDAEQHFSQHVPFKALKTPMLLNALLACGVLHLSMANQKLFEKASIYYDTATSQLLRNLQNPERNTEECATAAVVLNVYEAMTDKPAHRMSHVAGARALIKECGWNARSPGIGSACFWLNVGMEVLDCLAAKLPTTWDPSDWAVDMTFGPEPEEADDGMGGEELWVHRIFYIVAAVANFQAATPRYQEMSPHAEHLERSSRLCEWQKMKRMCDRWNNACPRSMHPMGYLDPTTGKSESCFPKIWLIKRPALLGRLLYHMGQCILAQTNPLEPSGTSKEMAMLQLHHAHQICGIVAFNRDRAMWTVAVRSIEIAAPSLVDEQEQDESLQILDRMNTRGSQWLTDVVRRLRRVWDQQQTAHDTQRICSPISDSGRRRPSMDDDMLMDFTAAPTTASTMGSRALSTQSAMSIPRTMDLEPSPLMSRDLMEALRSADFRHPEHPYQNWWQPASRDNLIAQFPGDFGGSIGRNLGPFPPHGP